MTITNGQIDAVLDEAARVRHEAERAMIIDDLFGEPCPPDHQRYERRELRGPCECPMIAHETLGRRVPECMPARIRIDLPLTAYVGGHRGSHEWTWPDRWTGGDRWPV